MGISLKRAHRNGAIIEHAIPLAPVFEGMMGAAAQMNGNTIIKGGKTGVNGCSGRTPGALNEFW